MDSAKGPRIDEAKKFGSLVERQRDAGDAWRVQFLVDDIIWIGLGKMSKLVYQRLDWSALCCSFSLRNGRDQRTQQDDPSSRKVHARLSLTQVEPRQQGCTVGVLSNQFSEKKLPLL